MNRLIFIIVMITMFACGQSGKLSIEETEQEAGFYISQLNLINNKLKKEKKTDFLYKRLFASQRLGWPEEDIEKDIQLLIGREGLDFELYNYAVDFFLTHRKYEALNELVDNWLEGRATTVDDYRWKVIALNGLQRSVEAGNFLWSLLQESSKPEDHLFVAQTYLNINDTARSIYAYSRFASESADHPAIFDEYIPILLKQGYPQKAQELLTQQNINSFDFEKILLLANTYFALGDQDKAINLLKKYDKKEESLFQLASWYNELNAWDSAVYFTNKMIRIDSSRQALFKKGEILEDRGWLNSALENYYSVIRSNPKDSIAISRAQIVERKIAYLRRLRERENPTPVLDISSKKSTENE